MCLFAPAGYVYTGLELLNCLAFEGLSHCVTVPLLIIEHSVEQKQLEYLSCLRSKKFDMPLSTTEVHLQHLVVCHINMPAALLWSSRGWWAGRPGDVRQQQEADGAQHEQQETLLLQGAWGRAASAEEVVYLQNEAALFTVHRVLYWLCTTRGGFSPFYF